MFERRHYEHLAATLRASHARSNSAWATIVREIADALELDNVRFQRARFLRACGYPTWDVVDTSIAAE